MSFNYRLQRMMAGGSRFGWGRVGMGLARIARYRLQQPTSGEVSTVSDDLCFQFDYPQQFSNSLVMFRELVEPEFELLRGLLSAESVLFDVGGGIGAYAVFASQFTKQPIHLFEPMTANIRTIQHNIATNNASQRVIVNPVAVSDKAGYGEMNAGERLFYSHLTSNAGGETPIITLDAYCEAHGINHIDILKVDTEDHEPQVLAGAEHLLSNGCIDWIILERSPKLLAFYQNIERHGYDCYAYHLDKNCLLPISLNNKSDIDQAWLSMFHSNIVFVRPAALAASRFAHPSSVPVPA